MAICKGCGAEILWGKTEAGKSQPLDAKPDPNGKWVIWDGMVIPWRDEPDDERRTSHFATCSKATEFRRK